MVLYRCVAGLEVVYRMAGPSALSSYLARRETENSDQWRFLALPTVLRLQERDDHSASGSATSFRTPSKVLSSSRLGLVAKGKKSVCSERVSGHGSRRHGVWMRVRSQARIRGRNQRLGRAVAEARAAGDKHGKVAR